MYFFFIVSRCLLPVGAAAVLALKKAAKSGFADMIANPPKRRFTLRQINAPGRNTIGKVKSKIARDSRDQHAVCDLEPAHAYGCVRSRRREEAVAVQEMTNWLQVYGFLR